MTTIVFTDKTIELSADLIEDALGPKSVHWQNICAYLVNLGGIQQGWTFYGKRNGWLLKSELKGRNLFFFVPGENEFSLTYTFGEKAYNFILSGDFPESVTEPLRKARKYAEGRILRFSIENKESRFPAPACGGRRLRSTALQSRQTPLVPLASLDLPNRGGGSPTAPMKVVKLHSG